LTNPDRQQVLWRQIVLGIGAIWLVLFVASFPVLHFTEPSGTGAARGLNRVAAFLTWQGLALVWAAVAAAVARTADNRGVANVKRRGVANVKRLGYAPLAASVVTILLMFAVIGVLYVLRPSFAGA
jgi:hypothetical protein